MCKVPKFLGACNDATHLQRAVSAALVYTPIYLLLLMTHVGSKEEPYKAAGQRDYVKRNKCCTKAYVQIM